jgi:CRISPR-associated endoribonuclease Cas6
MRLKLRLQTSSVPAFLPFNYQYPLSAAIYKIIQTADSRFAAFLHNQGYGSSGGRHFKLFTFSDLRTPFQRSGDRMQLLTGEAELVVCFYVPQAAETFIKGLFLDQTVQIGDARSKTTFGITQVESLPQVETGPDTVLLQPLSPLVVGRKNSRGHYDYRAPQDSDFAECLHHNWVEKCAAAGIPEEKRNEEIMIRVRPFAHPPQQRLITIKGGTDAETKIRGYTRFRLAVKAPKEVLEVALGAGLGLHNAQGMGCVGVVSG